MKIAIINIRKIVLLTAMAIFGLCCHSFSQSNNPYIRIVNIIVDSSKLEEFNTALKKGIEASVFSEPGTITIHAVFDKANPTHITVFEIYDDVKAHQVHQQTASFREYKEATNNVLKTSTDKKLVSIATIEPGGNGIEPVGNGNFIVSCWAGLIYYLDKFGKTQTCRHPGTKEKYC